MPLNPSIILGVRPPEDPIASMGRALSLRNMGQQQQIHAQQLQAGELGLQQQKQGIADDQAVRALFANGNPTDSDIMRTAGAKGSAIIKSRYEANEAAGKLKELTGKVAAAEGDYLGSLGMMVKNADYSPEAFGSLIQHATDAGYGSHMQPLIAAAQQDPASIKTLVDRMIDASPAQKKLANETTTATAHADTVANTAASNAPKTAAAWAATAGQLLGAAQSQDQWDAALAKLPPDVRKSYAPMFSTEAAKQAAVYGMTAEQRATLAGQEATRTQTAAHNAVTEQQGAARVRFEGQRVGLERKRFDATLGSGLDASGKPLSPEDLKAVAMRDPTAVAMANYQVPPPSTRSGALGKAQMDKILAIDPTYDATRFQARNKTSIDFSAGGKSGQALTSADTALAHLATISKAGEALKNGNIQVLNHIANSLGAQVGQSPQSTYDTVVAMVAPEISKAVIGAAGGESERQGMAHNFSSKASNGQREGAIGAAAQLLGARVGKSLHAYESTMGKPLSWKLSPESQQVLDRYSSGGGNGTVKIQAPDGTVREVSASDAEHYISKGAKKVQ